MRTPRRRPASARKRVTRPTSPARWCARRRIASSNRARSSSSRHAVGAPSAWASARRRRVSRRAARRLASSASSGGRTGGWDSAVARQLSLHSNSTRGALSLPDSTPGASSSPCRVASALSSVLPSDARCSSRVVKPTPAGRHRPARFAVPRPPEPSPASLARTSPSPAPNRAARSRSSAADGSLTRRPDDRQGTRPRRRRPNRPPPGARRRPLPHAPWSGPPTDPLLRQQDGELGAQGIPLADADAGEEHGALLCACEGAASSLSAASSADARTNNRSARSTADRTLVQPVTDQLDGLLGQPGGRARVSLRSMTSSARPAECRIAFRPPGRSVWRAGEGRRDRTQPCRGCAG